MERKGVPPPSHSYLLSDPRLFFWLLSGTPLFHFCSLGPDFVDTGQRNQSPAQSHGKRPHAAVEEKWSSLRARKQSHGKQPHAAVEENRSSLCATKQQSSNTQAKGLDEVDHTPVSGMRVWRLAWGWVLYIVLVTRA